MHTVLMICKYTNTIVRKLEQHFGNENLEKITRNQIVPMISNGLGFEGHIVFGQKEKK